MQPHGFVSPSKWSVQQDREDNTACVQPGVTLAVAYVAKKHLVATDKQWLQGLRETRLTLDLMTWMLCFLHPFPAGREVLCPLRQDSPSK